jgi:hypothetical protein
MDEMRRDRKIRMVLDDDNVEEYIALDLENLPPEEEQTEFMKNVVKTKEMHRDSFR